MVRVQRAVDKQRAARRVLDRLWTQPGSSYAAFAGQHLLRNAAAESNNRNKTKLGPDDVKHYLTQQAAYTQHAPAWKRFPKPFYNMVKLYHLVEIDLIETGRVAHFNDGVRYLLMAIECTSRKIFVVPMKDKTGKSSTEAFRHLLDHEFDATPHTVRSDRGSEWKDARFQKLLREKGIRHLYANNTEKVSMCERANRTLLSRVHRYLTHHGTFRFLPVLQQIVKSINDTPHASTGVAPSQFTESDVYSAWERYYLKHRQPQRPFRFKPGDKVRVSLLRREGMDKGYRGTYSPQIYTVKARRHTRPHSYELVDSVGEPHEGTFFEEEMIHANDRPDQRYMIRDVVERRTHPVTKKPEMLVTWEGWPDSVRHWLPSSAVVETRHGRQ